MTAKKPAADPLADQLRTFLSGTDREAISLLVAPGTGELREAGQRLVDAHEATLQAQRELRTAESKHGVSRDTANRPDVWADNAALPEDIDAVRRAAALATKAYRFETMRLDEWRGAVGAVLATDTLRAWFADQIDHQAQRIEQAHQLVATETLAGDKITRHLLRANDANERRYRELVPPRTEGDLRDAQRLRRLAEALRA